MATDRIFFSEFNDAEMLQAFQKAQDTFRYFWRELYWEYRRIVPALDLGFVKVIFSQEQEGKDHPLVEHMWIKDIRFNGEVIGGVLVNQPNYLTGVKKGDWVQIPLTRVSDWMFSTRDKIYGAYTIQLLRSRMNADELKAHDEAWGLNFGDPNDILVVYQQKEHPENLVEHPMSVNMKEKLEAFVKEYPAETTNRDEDGNTLLHKEAIAGNKTIVAVLLSAGAEKGARNNRGKTALDYAIELGWAHVTSALR